MLDLQFEEDNFEIHLGYGSGSSEEDIFDQKSKT